MDSAHDLTRILLRQRFPSTASRQIRLRLAKGLWDDDVFPCSVTGTESICGGIAYEVACLVTAPAPPLKSFIALPAEIQFVTDRGELRSVCGIVTEARAGDADGGLAMYRLVLRDALSVMEQRTNSRIFRYQSELEIVQQLFSEWRHSNAVLASAFDYELASQFDARQFPAREQTMQYNETDAAFVRRLLKRRGVSWYFRPGHCRSAALAAGDDDMPAHTLVLFDGAADCLPRNAADQVRYHREDATDGRDVVTRWTGARKLQAGITTRHSWDYKNPSAGSFMIASARGQVDQGSFGNELAATLDDYLVDIPHVGNDVEDHQRLGRLRMSRHGFETKCFYGEGSVRDFCAGQYFTLVGHPEIDRHPPGEREFVITELEVEAWNNLPEDLTAWAGRLARGRPFGPDASCCNSIGGSSGRPPIVVHFTAVRRGVPIVPDFDPRVDLPHPQLQSAIVVGPAGEDVYCDALGRVKIRFPGMREIDHRHAHGAGASGGPADSAWVRVVSNWAGSGVGARQQAGTLTLPRVGTEVMVSFLGGDPDRPVVTGQLFNQAAPPPAFSQIGDLPGNRYLSGMRTHEVKGQRGSQLRFDDTHGQISAQLASDHGTSELNLGWLTSPRANGDAEPRGEGAELRSDLSVAVRGARGVLITAEAAPGGQDAQLARAGLVSLADMLQGVLDEVGKLAEHHAGDESSGRLADLADKIRHWHGGSNEAPDAADGGAPIVAVTAPAGIALATSDHLALASSKKVDVASAGDTEIAAGRNIFVRAARGFSAFAHMLGIKLVAGRGDVLLQAHDGNIQIKASGRISLIAAEGIDLQAPEVKVVAAGAQTDWGHDGIVQQCAGKHVDRAAQFMRLGPAGGVPASLGLPSMQMRTDERLVLRHEQTGEPIPHLRYRAHLANGRVIEGVTDSAGHTSLAMSDAIGDVHFDFLPDEPKH